MDSIDYLDSTELKKYLATKRYRSYMKSLFQKEVVNATVL